MLLRKSSPAILTHNFFIYLPVGFTESSTSSRHPRKDTRQRGCTQTTRRTYASSIGQQDESNERARVQAIDPNDWPQPLVGQKCPTPYQILETNRKDNYSKARFYELVKFYHPDRQGSATDQDQLPHAIKIERYRLIVAAHSILSDPAKRSAYDRFGSGWNGKRGIYERSGYGSSSEQKPGPFSQSCDQTHDPIWANATWEDWERFYARRDREEGKSQAPDKRYQAPVYFQNTYFLALVILVIMMGSSSNYKRAQDNGTYFVEQRDSLHDRTAKELRRVRQEMPDVRSRDDRIDWFLRNRDANLRVPGSTIEAIREERADRLLPDREVCRSEGIVNKDT